METEERRKSAIPGGWRLGMGIFMILVYVGMGVCFFCDVFGWSQYQSPWPVMNYVFGAIFVLYGIYRGYRLIKGIGTPV